MKKLFLIPLLALFACVSAWANNVEIAQIGATTYYQGEAEDIENHVYATAQAALTAAVADVENEGTIKLLSDLTTEYITLNKSITIDLNGKTMARANTIITVNASSKLILINSNSGNEGCVNHTANSNLSFPIWCKSGAEVEINEGVIVQSAKSNSIKGADGSVVTINGGTLRKTPDSTNSSPAVISGSSTGATLTINGGTVESIKTVNTVVEINDGAFVGKITAQKASTITINEGATISSTSGEAIIAEANGTAIPTIIINGGTINYVGSANSDVILCNGAVLTMNGGSIVSPTSWYAIYAKNGAQVTVNGGSLTNTSSNKSAAVIDVLGNKTPGGEAINTTVNIKGGSIICQTGDAIGVFGKGATLNITGGTIDGKHYSISGNGTIAADKDYSGTTINISGGNIGSAASQGAIYHPQAGTLNIKGNPVIKGQTTIQMCSGTGMTGSITGGRIEAYGVDGRATKTGDGEVPDGAALSILNRNYPGGTPVFAVNGGVFLAQHQNAVLAYTWSSNTASEWEGATNFLSIREGIFSSDPSAFVPADGYTFTQLDPTPSVYNHDEVVYNELWQVQEADHVQSYDFTSANAEYVEIGTNTESDNVDHTNKEYILNEDQNSKKVEVIEEYTLVVKEDNTLNIGGGGLILEDNAQMVVEPGAVVTVGTNGIINPNGTENLVLESTDEKQAVLMIDPDVVQNTQPQATVTLITKAKQKRGTTADPVYEYIWDYFASPVIEITDLNKPTNNFDEAVHGLYTEQASFISGVYTWGGNDWQFVDSWKSLVPFKGYQLTNNSANGGVTYTFKGNLLGNGDGEYEFTSNGYGYFGNSYTAPIVISNFLSALDNAVYERTVWLYDAGADTYVSVNPLAARLGSAKYKDGTSIKEIRSLQAFILNKKADGANAQINYRDAIWNNPRINSLASPAPARREADEMQWMNIYVAANGNKEMVTLVEGVDFSSEFDNGADAGKYINNNGMNLYAATNDGEQAIVATDNLENTLISFQAGNATEYTLSFENGNEDYMLRDNVTGMTVAMEEGAEYTFTQAANTTVSARFEVIAAPKATTAIENVEETVKATGIYTITGQYMGRDFTNLPAGVYVVNGVKIVK